MTPSFALLLSLALPASADPPRAREELDRAAGESAGGVGEAASAAGRAVAGLEFSVEGCDEAQERRVRAAVADAMDKVENCLPNYNASIAGKIKRHFSKFKFSCDPQTRGHGGTTTHDLDRRGRLAEARIKLTMRSRLIQYSLAARTFHEMIHAVDPPRVGESGTANDGAYIVSASMHASAGFPDPVYGCQFACYGGVGEDEGKAMTRFRRNLGDGPEKERLDAAAREVACEDWEDCGARGLYAGLCTLGRPLATEEMRRRDCEANRPTRLAEALLNACSRIDEAARCRRVDADSLCGLRCMALKEEDGFADAAMSLAGALIAEDSSSLDEAGLGRYREARRRRILAACD